MTRHESEPEPGEAPVSGDLAGSLASALLWIDVATLSLERDDPRDLRAALSQARAQLQAVVGALTTSERRTGERRKAERRTAARRTADDRGGREPDHHGRE